MRIAIFYNLQVSGAKRVVYDHTKWLKKLENTVDIYYLENNDPLFDPASVAHASFRYIYKPIKIRLPIIKRLSEDLSDFYKLKSLHKKIAADIDKKNYDIVLVHTDRLTQAPFILQFLKTKNVYFCLEPLRMVYEYSLRIPDTLSLFNKIYESINRLMRKNIDRHNARCADFTTSISYFGRELMIQAFDLYPKISYLGIDTGIFKKTHGKKKNKILFVGQKMELNGYEYAIKAINLIPKSIRPELKVISWTNNKHERLTDEALTKEYNESLLTLSLSTYDTFGLVPLESLACGTSVIAFKTAGYRETLQDGVTGFLVDFDEKEIAEKIIYMIQHPKERLAMENKGEKWIDAQWTWEKKAIDLQNLLEGYIHTK